MNFEVFFNLEGLGHEAIKVPCTMYQVPRKEKREARGEKQGIRAKKQEKGTWNRKSMPKCL